MLKPLPINQDILIFYSKVNPHVTVVKDIFIAEPEGKQYGACFFNLHSSRVYVRVAKITPTKTGAFVTFWKRTTAGPIAPYENTDTVDF